jgi:hypothetical protein
METIKPWVVKRIVKNGHYLRAYVPDHPSRNKHGYVLHHRIVAENKIGRLLKKTEVVHHVDGNGKNNHPDNLVVLINNAEHCKLHGKERKRTFISLICKNCGKSFPREIRQVKKQPNHYCCRKCMGIYFSSSKNALIV